MSKTYNPFPNCDLCKFDIRLCKGKCRILQKEYDLENSALEIAQRDAKARGILFDSNKFQKVEYAIKDNHVIILAGDSGRLAIKFSFLEGLISELKEIAEVYAK